ncbi:Tocopherol O-methyltransferase, chloroplastic [Apostasia shenzhenica]|uniref:Tocopherol O-methyltransferase, chloroplastic n=1 Tax=Apostasia shenzhenica TaxID=1088818 RepID=A0A2I0A9F3_9ASPA|nr:Tocopherol O-methyltransferase, chloroplastic [Apostasia shenzhenica]
MAGDQLNKGTAEYYNIGSAEAMDHQSLLGDHSIPHGAFYDPEATSLSAAADHQRAPLRTIDEALALAGITGRDLGLLFQKLIGTFRISNSTKWWEPVNESCKAVDHRLSSGQDTKLEELTKELQEMKLIASIYYSTIKTDLSAIKSQNYMLMMMIAFVVIAVLVYVVK